MKNEAAPIGMERVIKITMAGGEMLVQALEDHACTLRLCQQLTVERDQLVSEVAALRVKLGRQSRLS